MWVIDGKRKPKNKERERERERERETNDAYKSFVKFVKFFL